MAALMLATCLVFCPVDKGKQYQRAYAIAGIDDAVFFTVGGIALLLLSACGIIATQSQADSFADFAATNNPDVYNSMNSAAKKGSITITDPVSLLQAVNGWLTGQSAIVWSDDSSTVSWVASNYTDLSNLFTGCTTHVSLNFISQDSIYPTSSDNWSTLTSHYKVAPADVAFWIFDGTSYTIIKGSNPLQVSYMNGYFRFCGSNVYHFNPTDNSYWQNGNTSWENISDSAFMIYAYAWRTINVSHLAQSITKTWSDGKWSQDSITLEQNELIRENISGLAGSPVKTGDASVLQDATIDGTGYNTATTDAQTTAKTYDQYLDDLTGNTSNIDATTGNILSVIWLIWNAVQGIPGLINIVTTLPQYLGDISDDLEWIPGIATTISSALEWVPSFVTPIQSLITGFPAFQQSLVDFVNGFPATVQQIGDFITGIPATFQDLFGTITAGLSDVGTGIMSGLQSLSDTLSGAISGVVTGVNTLVDSLSLTMTSIIAAIQTGILDLTGAIADVWPFKWDPEPNPDEDEKPSSESDFNYITKFPFCIPWDVQYMLNSLGASNASPEAPNMDYPFPYMDSTGLHFETRHVDLSQFDNAAALMRVLNGLSICLGILFVTHKVTDFTRKKQ